MKKEKFNKNKYNYNNNRKKSNKIIFNKINLFKQLMQQFKNKKNLFIINHFILISLNQLRDLWIS